MTSNNFFFMITFCIAGFGFLAFTAIIDRPIPMTLTVISAISFFIGSLYFVLKDYEIEYAKIS